MIQSAGLDPAVGGLECVIADRIMPDRVGLSTSAARAWRGTGSGSVCPCQRSGGSVGILVGTGTGSPIGTGITTAAFDPPAHRRRPRPPARHARARRPAGGGPPRATSAESSPCPVAHGAAGPSRARPVGLVVELAAAPIFHAAYELTAANFACPMSVGLPASGSSEANYCNRENMNGRREAKSLRPFKYTDGWLGSVFGPRFPIAECPPGVRRRTPAHPSGNR